jgi:hypothetical protein
MPDKKSKRRDGILFGRRGKGGSFSCLLAVTGSRTIDSKIVDKWEGIENAVPTAPVPVASQAKPRKVAPGGLP